MSIQNEIDRLAAAKQDIKSALEEQGQAMADDETLDTYADKVRSIQSYPSGGETGQVLTKTDDGAEWADVPETDISGKMDASNPTGTGALSLNRKAGTTVGQQSVAEGYNTAATGWASHAEGSNTSASNDGSHAEGGFAKASGTYAHAEGSRTTAQRKSQHVQGEYNVLDAAGTPTTRGDYAHIVGNGTSDESRSNAHTLDWSGNAWFAGDVYVRSDGGTNRDAGSKRLATEEDVAVAVAGVAGVRLAYIVINADQWTEGDTDHTLTISAETHGMADPKRTIMQIQGPDGPGPATWRSMETYMTVASDNSIVLHAPSAYDGAVLLMG